MEAIKLMISEEQEEMFLKQFYQIATKAIEKAQENCAVFVLIKGSGTVMRYFGVDIGLKEGYGQLASAFG
ncbi:hypothetical protein EfmAA818_06170 [Enterococcus faecium]|nr:hypothetical protein EfmAA818_06170 [Enterococcus faecium]